MKIWNDLHYFDNPYTRHEETFEECVAAVGDSEIYKDIITDSVTISALDDYFALDRLCAYRKKFIWLYRRRLREAYPVYRNQMDMWEQRIILGWFKDNDKLNKTVTAEDINTVGKEVRSAIDKIDVVAKDVFDGNTDENQNTNTSSNGKSRDFAFVYPESNYSGGVIPYDLDNNPNVEFISTQADNVNRSSASTEQSGNTKTDNTTDSTSTTNEESSSNADTTGNTDRDVTTTFTYTGTDISTLADQILAQLPATDFFRQFAEKLQGCFQRVYLVDEQLEEEGENYYV